MGRETDMGRLIRNILNGQMEPLTGGSVLCIDPAKTSAAWALLSHSGDLLGAGLVRWAGSTGPIQVPALWMGGPSVLMEWPQVYKTGAADAHDLLSLTFTLGRVCAITGAGIAQAVHPYTWKGNAPKRAHIARVAQELPSEWRSVRDAALALVPASLQHNVHDAVSLAWWLHQTRTSP